FFKHNAHVLWAFTTNQKTNPLAFSYVELTLNMLQPKELIGRRNGRSWSIHVFNVFVGVLLFVHNSLYLWFVTMK
ncbi:hypothetical protein, partial [Porphyromonas gingivalis]|uniref:hypothetical protein n=1 Tax=Porphyromonas gingivalis TaxID=837 RepID=UPI001C4E18D9